MLCWFLPNINMNRPQVYICPFPLKPPSNRIPQQIPPGCLFTQGNVRVSILLFPSVPPSASLTVSTSLFNVCVSITALKIGSSVASFEIPYAC